MKSRTWRLNSTDEMLYDSAAALGSARVIQLLWRFPGPVATGALEAEWRRLDRGRLSRQVASPRVPGSRRKWVHADNVEALRVDSRPLTGETATDWIDEQVRAPLPTMSGKLWRLAAAPYADGTLVSLTVPHFRCDGLGLFGAVGEAADAPARPVRPPAPQEPHAPRPPRTPRAAACSSDLADATAQIARALAALAGTLASPSRRRALRSAISNATRPVRQPPAPQPAAGRTAGSAAPDSRPRFFTSIIVDLDARSWEERAAANGGTINSLFVQIAANLVRARVPRDPLADIEVGIPVSLRGLVGDERANALVVVPLVAPGGTVAHGDLRPVRLAARELLQNTGTHSATLVPEPLWHLLPTRWASVLKAPGAQQTDVVASNFGSVPAAVARFAGAAGVVALRTMNVPGLVPDRARLRASLVLLRSGDLMTMTVTGMPDYFGDARSLSDVVSAELAAWGLTGRPWWGPGLTL
jgi:diacylglycerol O-acyltransferase / wax synthase